MQANRIAHTPIVGAGPARDFLARNGRERAFTAGQYLWRASDRAEVLHVLLGGTVRIVRHRRDRAVLIHSVETKWQIFGEVPVLTGRGYPASAVAETDVRCLLVSMRVLREASLLDPSVMESMMRGLAHRLDELVARIEENTLASVRSRLALYLRSQWLDGDGNEIVSYGSHQALANILGTVREVVAREVTRLKREGLIASRGRGKLAILDHAGLDEIADGEVEH